MDFLHVSRKGFAALSFRLVNNECVRSIIASDLSSKTRAEGENE